MSTTDSTVKLEETKLEETQKDSNDTPKQKNDQNIIDILKQVQSQMEVFEALKKEKEELAKKLSDANDTITKLEKEKLEEIKSVVLDNKKLEKWQNKFKLDFLVKSCSPIPAERYFRLVQFVHDTKRNRYFIKFSVPNSDANVYFVPIKKQNFELFKNKRVDNEQPFEVVKTETMKSIITPDFYYAKICRPFEGPSENHFAQNDPIDESDESDESDVSDDPCDESDVSDDANNDTAIKATSEQPKEKYKGFWYFGIFDNKLPDRFYGSSSDNYLEELPIGLDIDPITGSL